MGLAENTPRGANRNFAFPGRHCSIDNVAHTSHELNVVELWPKPPNLIVRTSGGRAACQEGIEKPLES